jgi:hypothetical protein
MDLPVGIFTEFGQLYLENHMTGYRSPALDGDITYDINLEEDHNRGEAHRGIEMGPDDEFRDDDQRDDRSDEERAEDEQFEEPEQTEEGTSPTGNSTGFHELEPLDGTLSYRPTANNTLLEVKVTMPTTGWIAVGYSLAGGSSMHGPSGAVSNIIKGDVVSNSPVFEDRYGTGQSAPSLDTSNGGLRNVTSISGIESSGNTTRNSPSP